MKRINHVLLFLGLGFLVYLIWKVGPQELWRESCALGWGIIPIVLSEGLANLAHTMGWRQCVRGPRIPLPRLFRFAMAGYGINYFTPTGTIGGEISKVALLSSSRKSADAVSSVVLDKLMTGVGHLLLAVFGCVLLLWRVSLPRDLWIAMAVTTGLMGGGMAIFLILQQRGKLGWLCRKLAQRRIGGRLMQNLARRIAEVDAALQDFYRERPGNLVRAVCWHLAGHSMAILQVWIFLRLVGEPGPFATVAAAGFLSLWFDLLTFAVPLNLGTLEGSRMIVFKSLGCSGLQGMAFGLAIRVAQMFWACFGLASYTVSQFVPGRSPRKTTEAGLSPSRDVRPACGE